VILFAPKRAHLSARITFSKFIFFVRSRKGIGRVKTSGRPSNEYIR